MIRIGIVTCSNATQELGCSSVACLADLRKRKGAFSDYPIEESLALVGILSCPGCPTLSGTQKFEQRIRGLTEFKVDAIHFAFCVKALCPFKKKYIAAIKTAHPEINVIEGTHEEHVTGKVFREEAGNLFCQPRKNMIDLILGRS